MGGPGNDPRWLEQFHQGDPRILEELYVQQFDTVNRAVGTHLQADDRETVVHEVFFKLICSPEVRMSFRGGSVAAWLTTLARNQAIDFLRHHRRTVPVLPFAGSEDPTARLEAALDARRLIERFRREVLPAKWQGVFEARFLLQLEQKEAAQRLGLGRTTLAYQEYRVRALLRRFLLRGDV